MTCTWRIPCAYVVVKTDPDILGATPRFTVARALKNLFDRLENGGSLDVLPDQSPSVRREQAVALLEARRQALLTA